MSRVRWNQRDAAPANAARVLPRLMSEYFSDVRAALRAKPSPAHMHAIRLASKKIRYTLELFEGCYGAEFGARMKALKDVQTALGDVNDAVAAAKLIRRAMPKSIRRKTLLSFLETRAAEKAEEFHVHWNEKFDAPGEEDGWTALLKSPRRVSARPRSRKAARPRSKKAAPAHA